MAVLLNLPPPQRLPGGLGRLGQIPLVIITRPPVDSSSCRAPAATWCHDKVVT